MNGESRPPLICADPVIATIGAMMYGVHVPQTGGLQELASIRHQGPWIASTARMLAKERAVDGQAPGPESFEFEPGFPVPDFAVPKSRLRSIPVERPVGRSFAAMWAGVGLVAPRRRRAAQETPRMYRGLWIVLLTRASDAHVRDEVAINH